MKKVLVSIVFVFALIGAGVHGESTIYLFNEEKTNFSEGVGNITYPRISAETKKETFLFSNSIVVGDVNGDGSNEIIAISLEEGAIYVYNQNLTLLWKYIDSYYVEHMWYASYDSSRGVGVSSLTLVDLNNDGIKDILFSISPGLSFVSVPNMDYYPQTVFHAFSGNGTEIWNLTLKGGITADSVIISDINSDSNPEIIVGSDNIYVINFEGQITYSHIIDNSSFTGVYSIIGKADTIIFSFWQYKYPQSHGCVFSKPFSAYFSLRLIRFQNSNFTTVWTKLLEDPDDFQGPEFYRMFSDDELSSLYITQTQPSGLVKINISSGETEWEKISDSTIPPGVTVSVLPDGVVWNKVTEVSVMDKSGKEISSFEIYNPSEYSAVWSVLAVFDVNNNSKNEVILMDREGMFAFSMDGKKEWYAKMWERAYGYWNPPPSILHADTDNDDFEEIITINPNGRIVIIDSGTPPESEEPETLTNNLMFAGIGAGAIAISVAAVWIWRKRRDEN